MFALFTGSQYYPSGGWHDYEGTYDTQLEAYEACVKISCDWWHIIDLSTGAFVDQGER
jgi:hypothetical protein